MEIALRQSGCGALVPQWDSMSQSRVYVGYCSICKVKVPLPSETRFHQSDQKHSNSGVGDGFMVNVFSLSSPKTPVL